MSTLFTSETFSQLSYCSRRCSGVLVKEAWFLLTLVVLFFHMKMPVTALRECLWEVNVDGETVLHVVAKSKANGMGRFFVRHILGKSHDNFVVRLTFGSYFSGKSHQELSQLEPVMKLLKVTPSSELVQCVGVSVCVCVYELLCVANKVRATRQHTHIASLPQRTARAAPPHERDSTSTGGCAAC